MHPREAERLAALLDYRILDTEPEATFDHLVALATEITHTPLGALSFLDLKRQWFKASRGLEVSETDRRESFCAHAIAGADPVFTVADATKDPRFADNPLVTGEPGIRFYAGVPLNTPDGLPLGSLCVIDRKPRKLTAAQEKMLQHVRHLEK
jgi:GAF domain-containing protein